MIILVQDDDKDTESIPQLLRSELPDVEVRVSQTGDGALDIIDQARPGAPMLVVLDPLLRDSSGFDLLKRIRQSPRTRHIPVVMLSDPTDTVALGKSYDLGANSCLDRRTWSARAAQDLKHIARYWLQLNYPGPSQTEGNQ